MSVNLCSRTRTFLIYFVRMVLVVITLYRYTVITIFPI